MNRGVLAVGVACVALGVARTTGTVGPILPGGTYGFVAAGVAAAVLAAASLYRDRGAVGESGTSAPPERSRPRRPGADAADAIDGLRVVGRRPDAEDGRGALYERLEALAVDVLVAKRDVTPAEARALLESGAWTDDPEAAACFRDGALPALSARDQLAALRSGDPPFARRVRRAVAALDRLEGDG